MSPTERVALGSWVLLMLVSLASAVVQYRKNRTNRERARGWILLCLACVVWVVAGILGLAGTGVFVTMERVGTLIAVFGVYYLWSGRQSP